MNQYGTKIADEATIKAQFLKDNFPDANGRYGLFICNKTCNYILVIKPISTFSKTFLNYTNQIQNYKVITFLV